MREDQRRLIVTPEEARRERAVFDEGGELSPIEMMHRIAEVDDEWRWAHVWAADQTISEAERNARETLVWTLSEELKFLGDAVRAIHSGQMTFQQVNGDKRFRRAYENFFSTLRTQGLHAFLESHAKQEHKEENGDMADLLPTEVFDASWYSPEEVLSATEVLMHRIEEIVGQESEHHGTVDLLKEYLFGGPMVEAFVRQFEEMKKGNKTAMIDLHWVKLRLQSVSTKDGKSNLWQDFLALVHDNKQVLYAIFGRPSDSDDVREFDSEEKAKRSAEVYASLANMFHLALATSAERMYESDAGGERQKQKDILTEFYGKLPDALNYEAEALILQKEIETIVAGVKDERQKEIITEGLKEMSRRFGKEKSLEFGWDRFCKAVEAAYFVSGSPDHESEAWQSMARKMFDFQKKMAVMTDHIPREVRHLFDSLVDLFPMVEKISPKYFKFRDRKWKEETVDLIKKEKQAFRVSHAILRLLNRGRPPTREMSAMEKYNEEPIISDRHAIPGNAPPDIHYRRILGHQNIAYIKQVRSRFSQAKKRSEPIPKFLDGIEENQYERWNSSYKVWEPNAGHSEPWMYDFSGWYITGDELRDHENLAYVSFDNAEFREADIAGADLTGASFRGAHFENSSIVASDIRETDWSGANIKDSFFTGAFGEQMRMRGATISRCSFLGLLGHDSDWSESTIDESAFSGSPYDHGSVPSHTGTLASYIAPEHLCNLREEDKALISGADSRFGIFAVGPHLGFQKSVWKNVKMRHSQMVDMPMDAADWSGAQISASDFLRMHFPGGIMRNAILDKVNMLGLFAPDSEWQNAHLTHVDLSDTIGRSNSGADTILGHSKWGGAFLEDVDFPFRYRDIAK